MRRFFFLKGAQKSSKSRTPEEKEYKERLITGYFRVKTNQPSPSFLSCKLETKKNLILPMYQKRVTLPDTGSLILKHFEMTELHVQSALYENFLDLTPNICSGQI